MRADHSFFTLIKTTTLGALLCCAVFMFASQTAFAHDGAHDGPADTVKSFHAAMSAGDEAGVLKALAENVMIFEGGGVEMSRQEYENHHMKADMKGNAGAVRNVTSETEKVFGTIATVLSTTLREGSRDGKAYRYKGTETMVLEKRADGWKIIHIHWSGRVQRD